jgi:hypothetical protein
MIEVLREWEQCYEFFENYPGIKEAEDDFVHSIWSGYYLISIQYYRDKLHIA